MPSRIQVVCEESDSDFDECKKKKGLLNDIMIDSESDCG